MTQQSTRATLITISLDACDKPTSRQETGVHKHARYGVCMYRGTIWTWYGYYGMYGMVKGMESWNRIGSDDWMIGYGVKGSTIQRHSD